MTTGPTPVLWVCGPPCVGKSVVGWELFSRLFGAGIKAAYVDLAQVGFYRPAPEGDPTNHRIRARNLGGMWRTFQEAGVRSLVMSGGVDRSDVAASYARALPGTALTICRLRAGPDQLTERVHLRGHGRGPAIPGDELRGRSPDYLRSFAVRAVANADRLDHAGFDAVCVDTDGRSVDEVADDVSRLTTLSGG